MALFLLSLTVLFVAGLVAWAVIGSRLETWPPAGTPPLPGFLWWSTGLIAAGSLTAQRAVTTLRANRTVEFRRAFAATIILGVAFLASQTAAWTQLVSHDLTMRSSLAGWLFYFLTGLHAAHVLGGLIPIGLVTRRAFRGPLNRDALPTVRYCTMYWHFLGLVWLVLFAVLARSLVEGAVPGP
jgi:cytochrome c oxidase subunit 3